MSYQENRSRSLDGSLGTMVGLGPIPDTNVEEPKEHQIVQNTLLDVNTNLLGSSKSKTPEGVVVMAFPEVIPMPAEGIKTLLTGKHIPMEHTPRNLLNEDEEKSLTKIKGLQNKRKGSNP